MTLNAWAMAMVAVGVVAAAPLTADAATRKKGADRSRATVQTCSNYGHGCATAPIRRGSVGEELRMPGGTWISCRQDCKTALREEVLDFWETLRERSGDNFD